MLLDKVDAQYSAHDLKRLHQGDIIRDIQIDIAVQAGENAEVVSRTHDYAVVLTQDCDLEQDVSNRSGHAVDQDKYLESILLCPAYRADLFREGGHLRAADLKMRRINSEAWRQIKANNNVRYHYLPPYAKHQVAELVIDFKHYFTAPREVLYGLLKPAHCLATLEQLFRENLSTRYSGYLSRIALPDVQAAT